MVAVDIMGGDQAPHAIVEGAVAAARKGVPVLLCGKKESILSCLPQDWELLPITLEFCDEYITMAEEPGRAIRNKPNSSLVRAMKAVASGKAAAFFSAGNSGAVLVASVVISGRVRGLHRPAVGAFLPTQTGKFFCLDVGANVDCKAQFLYQFALMGHAYVQVTQQIENPRIGLLSNAHEPYKGALEVRKAYEQLARSSLNFIGNIEAREVGSGEADVVVCDGFVGNVMLKTIQGTAHMLFSWIKGEAKCSWIRRFLLWLNRGLFRSIKARTDYASVGGALLLGVKHPVVFAHGRSDARAVENGILFAHAVIREKRVQRFNAKLVTLLNKKNTFTGAVSVFLLGDYL